MSAKHCMATAMTLCLLLTQTVADAQQTMDERADERQRRVVKILRTTNKAQVNQFVPLAFDMNNVNPYEVLRFLSRPVQAEEGNHWTFVHPDGDKGIFLTMVPIWMVESISQLARDVDRKGLTSSSGSKTQYVELKHRDPADTGFVNAVLANMTPTGKAIVDRARGALFLDDAPSGVEGAMAYMDAMDVPTQQVLVSATIYEIDLTNDGTIGLDFHAWKNGPGRNLAAFGVFNEYYKSTGLENSPQAFNPGVATYGLPGQRLNNEGWNVAYNYTVPSAYFDFLVVKGKGRVLTAPRAMVRNGEAATFFTGEQILYYQTQLGAAPTAGARPADLPLDPLGRSGDSPDNRTVAGATTPRGIPGVASVGVSLDVAPLIATEHISLNVQIEIVSHLGFDDQGAPLLSSRDLTTDLKLAPGAEYIIGGMTRTTAVQSTQKMPILGSLPIVGWAFGKESTTSKKTLLVIALSATPVMDYSGMSLQDSETLEMVNTRGMDSVPMRESLFGFDQYLLNQMAD